MKKYLILAASAALLLASCAKVETTTKTVWDENIPIGFGNYSLRPLSKAGTTYVNSGSLPTGAVIGVYGYSTGTDNFAGTEKPTFMDETFKVTYSGASNVATATNTVRYWPKDIKNLLSFYGYFPYQDASITAYPTKTSDGLGSFSFTQTGAVTSMVDFMVSEVENDYYYTNNAYNATTNPTGEKNEKGTLALGDGYVPLKLHHMLAKVNFKFNKADYLGDDVIVKVTSASIAGVLSKGTLTPTFTKNATTTWAKGTTAFPELWEGSANTAYASAIVIPIDKGGNAYIELQKANASDINSATVANQNFLFVPQTLSDDVKVTINYTIKQGDADPVENTATVKLKVGTNPTSWGVSDNIVYTFTIGLNAIKFTADVQGWDAETAGAISVN